MEASHILKCEAGLKDGLMLLAGTLVLGVHVCCAVGVDVKGDINMGHAQGLNTQGEGRHIKHQHVCHVDGHLLGPGLLARRGGDPVLYEQVKVVLVALLRVLGHGLGRGVSRPGVALGRGGAVILILLVLLVLLQVDGGDMALGLLLAPVGVGVKYANVCPHNLLVRLWHIPILGLLLPLGLNVGELVGVDLPRLELPVVVSDVAAVLLLLSLVQQGLVLLGRHQLDQMQLLLVPFVG